MPSYLLKRVASTLIILLGLSAIVFFTLRVLPGDPTSLLGGQTASEEDIRLLRQQLGLDQPIPLQYFTWLTAALKGDLGRSLFSGRPVVNELILPIQATFELITVGFSVGLVMGLILGTIGGIKQNTLWDRVTSVLSVLTISTPSFFLGILMIYIFGVTLHILPAGARGGVENLILPSLAYSAFSMGFVSRMTRASVLETIRQDYVRTARAKGASWIRVTVRHVLRNALIPVVTVIGIQLGVVLSSAVAVEVVFAWPGLGRLLVDSILRRDYPVVQGAILFIAVVVTLSNLIVDLVYAYLDPRIRLK